VQYHTQGTHILDSLKYLEPSDIFQRTTPKFWLPTLTVVWGIVATLMGVVHNLAGFFVVRFL
jgi:hypothetical protein